MSPLALVEDRVAAEAGTAVLDFLASRLARLLGERVAAGLHRGYVELAEHGPSFQGQLDLPAHLREPLGRKDRLHCRYDDFTTDVPCNQLTRASAERLAGLPFLNENVRAALRHALGAFATVQPLEPTPECFAAALSDRLTEAYHPLLTLCQLLTEGMDTGTAGGATPCPAFLIDMERVFERYVTEGVLKAFRHGSRFSAAVQPLHCA